jgi:peptidoglycan/xylan/chitin deacetylase (PgdA/CDA1 family)
MTLRKAASQSFLGVARATGAFALSANSLRRRNRLLVLCYHGIALEDEDRWSRDLYISPSRFERRMRLLRSFGANVLPLGEAMDRLYRNSLPPRSVVITFDDGFVDFHVHAAPLLQRFGYPATLYLTTHYCLHRKPIFNVMLHYLMWKSGRAEMQLPNFGLREAVSIRAWEDRAKLTSYLTRWVEKEGLGTEARDDLARQLAGEWGLDYERILKSRILQLMTPDEVAQTARSGIAVELHTHRHRTPRDRDLFIRELRDNADRIREFTGRAAEHFCYPSGDYDPCFFPWLREFGVRSATTCRSGLADSKMDPLLIPRMLDDGIATELDFERWLCGFSI